MTEDQSSAERLQERMDAASISVSELAQETGLSRSTVYRMLDGDSKGTLFSWECVARFFGVSVTELIGR